MLFDRLRDRDDESILYHYCAPETFVEIIKNRTVRFSDINLLNDEEEGRYGYDVFIDSANELLELSQKLPELKGLDKQFLDLIDTSWSGMAFRMASFVACFSSDGDSLSQWRAYANDATGFAIGFRASRIRAMPVQLMDVLYDPAKQLDEMKIAIGGLYMKSIAENMDPQSIASEAIQIAASSVSFKNPAWHEEKEVRAQHIVDVELSEEKMILRDHGGETDKGEVDGEAIQFQSRRGTITPFIDMHFEVSENVQPIAEVVMGPRCANAPGNILLALGSFGFENVEIKTAGAAYR